MALVKRASARGQQVQSLGALEAAPLACLRESKETRVAWAEGPRKSQIRCQTRALQTLVWTLEGWKASGILNRGMTASLLLKITLTSA